MFKKRRRANTQRRRPQPKPNSEDGRIQHIARTETTTVGNRLNEGGEQDESMEDSFSDDFTAGRSRVPFGRSASPGEVRKASAVLENADRDDKMYSGEEKDQDVVMSGQYIWKQEKDNVMGKGVDVSAGTRDQDTYPKQRLEEMKRQYLAPSDNSPEGVFGTEKGKDLDHKMRPEGNRYGEVRVMDKLIKDHSLAEERMEDLGEMVTLENAIEAEDSEDEEWEKEQLKRAGILAGPQLRETTSGFGLSEDLLNEFGMNGKKKGLQKVQDSVFARVRDDILARPGSTRMDDGEDEIHSQAQLNRILEQIADVVNKNEKELSDLKRDVQNLKEEEERLVRLENIRERKREEAGTRAAFYSEFKVYINDLTDMLEEKQSVAGNLRKKKLSRLQRLARRRLNDVDSFGRQKRIQLRGDGFDSDEDEGEVFEQDGLDPEDQGEVHSEVEGMNGSSSAFEDVDPEYINVTNVLERFLKWKSRYPEDYSSAYGDLSAGKVIGTLTGFLCDASQSGPSESDLDFTAQLPESARGPAFLASKIVDVVAMQIRVYWSPASMSSTKKFISRFCKIRTYFENTQDRYKERAEKVWETIRSSITVVIRAELSKLKSLTYGETLVLIRRAVKISQNIVRMISVLERVEGLESLIAEELYFGIILARLEELPESQRSASLLFAVNEGLKDYPGFSIPQSAMWKPFCDRVRQWRLNSDTREALNSLCGATKDRCANPNHMMPRDVGV